MICFFLSKDLGKKTYIFIQPRNPTTWKTAVAVNFHQLETPKTSQKNGTLGFPGNHKIHENFGPRSFILLVTSDVMRVSTSFGRASNHQPGRKLRGTNTPAKTPDFFWLSIFFGVEFTGFFRFDFFFRNEIVRLSFGKTGKHTDLHTCFLLGGFERKKNQLQEWGNIIVRSRPEKRRGQSIPEWTLDYGILIGVVQGVRRACGVNP